MLRTLMVTLLMLAWAVPAHAYVGPGLGLGTLMAILGTIGAIVLAFFGLLWYPIKRLIRRTPAGDAADDGHPRS